MEKHGILFLLIMIQDAHSTAWPAGLKGTPTPQKSFDERIERANSIFSTMPISKAFVPLIDGWDDEYSLTFRAWPDVYYLIDENHKVLAKSTYGVRGDALLDVDCVDIIREIIQNDNDNDGNGDNENDNSICKFIEEN